MKITLFCLLAVLLAINTCLCQENTSAGQTLRVAGLQMNVTSSIPENKAKILAGIRKAASGKATFLVTPEGSLSGYRSKFDQKELLAALKEVLSSAKELKVGLLLGTCFKNDVGKCFNQVRIYSPEGEFIGAHSKILVCSPIDEPGTGEMLEYEQGVLQTFLWNNIRFGALVCNDLWATPGYTTISNPYLPLRLKEMGAAVIFHSINSGTNQFYRKFHESSAELWALNLKIPIMEVNAAPARQSDKVNAQSGLIDLDGLRAVIVPDAGEHLYFCDINLTKEE